MNEEYDITYGVCSKFFTADWDSLSKPYTQCDIDYVVKNMGALKAPRLYGFQPLFYHKIRRLWPLMFTSSSCLFLKINVCLQN